MTISYLEYELQNGFIHNWLVAGPQMIPIQAPQTVTEAEFRTAAAQKLFEQVSGVQKMPVEPGPLTEGIFTLGDYQTSWVYTACDEDHRVERSHQCPGWNYLRAWAYTQLGSKEDQQVTLTITAYGPVDLWLNKKPVFHSELFAERIPQPQQVTVRLRKGKNELVVRFANAAAFHCPLALAVHVGQNSAPVIVRIPTAAKSAERRREIEDIMRTAYTERDVFAAGDVIRMFWPKENPRGSFINLRLQTPSGRIYGESEADGEPGETLGYMAAAQMRDGHYHFLQMPRNWEVYESNIRIFNPLELWVAANAPYRTVPTGSLEQRRGELMRYAAQFENNLYAEIARVAVGDWENLDLKIILDSIHAIQKGEEGSVVAFASLLNLLAHLDDSASLPDAAAAPIEPALEKAALAYAYAQTPDIRMDFASESRVILFHACEIIAGQRYVDRVFADGQTGQEHRTQGEASAQDWMRSHGKAGFSTWESPATYAETLLALALLIDVAESEPVWELASVLMDKILFALSINTFQGVFGAAHRRAGSLAQRSGLLEETAGITYLLWGMGIYNTHLAAPVNLALLKNYELPPIFEQIAADGEVLLGRERQSEPDGEANLMSYRTADYMLSSAQDYRKGEVGDQEQVWRATLGPDAVVFTNHPGASSDGTAAGGPQPGFWAGNRSLPRIAQWKDVLVAIYNLPAEPLPAGGLGFTHAYFPTSNFDEYTLQNNWAFARKGTGYLALTASHPITMTTTGPHAFRELRADGSETIWVCQMGSAAQDESFTAFQERILALPVEFSGLSVSITTVRGLRLAFSWEEPLTLNDMPMAITRFPQYDNPFCVATQPAEAMEIRTRDYLLRLNFEEE